MAAILEKGVILKIECTFDLGIQWFITAAYKIRLQWDNGKFFIDWSGDCNKKSKSTPPPPQKKHITLDSNLLHLRTHSIRVPV